MTHVAVAFDRYEMVSQVFSFIVAVLSHWQSYATGGIVTGVVGLIERVTDWKMPKKMYVFLFVVIFLLVSFFLAWRDQYQVALRIPGLEQQIRDRDQTIQNLKDRPPQINVPPAIVSIPAAPRSAARIAKPAPTQNNSGGINVQQATTGDNSSIVNSPITVGNIQRHISQKDILELSDYLLRAQPLIGSVRIVVSADQSSGGTPFVTEFYDLMKAGRWPVVGNDVHHVITFAQSHRFKGATIIVKGEPLNASEDTTVHEPDPLYYIGVVLSRLNIPRQLDRQPDFEDGVIEIRFEGGIPDEQGKS